MRIELAEERAIDLVAGLTGAPERIQAQLPAGGADDRPDPMILPGSEDPVVGAAKVRDYLLSHEHPVGRFKAVFFETLGYSRTGWPLLQRDLMDFCRAGTVVVGQSSAFGRKYEVRGSLQGPSGRRAEVVTIWVVLVGEKNPRFVTAFPG